MPAPDPKAMRLAEVRPDGHVVVEAGPDPRTLVLERHVPLEGWILLATLDPESPDPVAVLERFGPSGELRYVAANGVRLSLPTTLEPTARSSTTSAALAFTGPDLLRGAALAWADDPTLEGVSAQAAPIRRLKDGPGERPHTFVGTPHSDDVVPVYYDASRATNRVNPLVVAPEAASSMRSQTLVEGLIGGWLPIVKIGYPLEDGDSLGGWMGGSWETVVFADMTRGTDQSQPAWYRFLRLGPLGVTAARYVDTYLPYPVGVEPSAEDFYRALAATCAAWERFEERGARARLPDPWVHDFVRHSFALDSITRHQGRPRYGVVDRVYGAREHDGFQDTLNLSVAALLAWGRTATARGHLDEYFEDFVREDGSLDYRGPEIGQYAHTLELIAQYESYTGDRSLVDQHRSKIRAIVELLLDRRASARALPEDHPAHGLIRGRHEADISFDTPTLAVHDYEQPYFSNSARAWRGLRDLGQALGRGHGPALAALGERMEDACVELRADLRRAVDRSWIDVPKPGGGTVQALPLYPGASVFYRDAPYRSRPESYDENRVWGETLGSGALDGRSALRIIDFGAALGDTAWGIWGNRKLAVAFTAAGSAFALIRHGRVREFLAWYFAHVAHCHTRGTWTAVECSDLDRDRAEHLPYCLPAQMVVPLATRWMTVFEDCDDPTLRLLPATPRRWLSHGQRIRLTRLPTRYGPISLRVDSHLAQDRIDAWIDVPPGAPARLELRLPLGHRVIAATTVDSAPGRAAIEVHDQEIRLPAAPFRSEVRVAIRTGRQ
ncbi:MAG: hypothetical protein LBK95_16715 [Bifidobacteriaceae bacterium]|jgi:hypothetical protein|nr:hypothetical protein [Bifidobacteriaceae bacterium]